MAETEPDDSRPHGFHPIKWKWSIPSWGVSLGEDCGCGHKIVMGEWFSNYLNNGEREGLLAHSEMSCMLWPQSYLQRLFTNLYKLPQFNWELLGYEWYGLIWMQIFSHPQSLLILETQIRGLLTGVWSSTTTEEFIRIKGIPLIFFNHLWIRLLMKTSAPIRLRNRKHSFRGNMRPFLFL